MVGYSRLLRFVWHFREKYRLNDRSIILDGSWDLLRHIGYLGLVFYVLDLGQHLKWNLPDEWFMIIDHNFLCDNRWDLLLLSNGLLLWLVDRMYALIDRWPLKGIEALILVVHLNFSRLLVHPDPLLALSKHWFLLLNEA